MRVNRGKQFEEQIKNSLSRVRDTAVVRLHDPQGGFAGVCNICDFIVFKSPHQYYLECKSCYGNTLSFSNITKHQWSGLLAVSNIYKVVAGVVVWFIDHDRTIFLPIQSLQQMREANLKSVNIRKIDEQCPHYINIPGTKRRILFDYDFTEFLGV